MADDLLERLDAVRRTFSHALIIGGDFETLRPQLENRGLLCVVADPGPGIARAGGGVVCDEDRLAFADNSFDLVVAIGSLDTVTDLPGALALIHRSLRPGGLFLGAMIGAGSLPVMKSSVSAEDGATIMRFHPQIDVRGAGDLLARATFEMPVAESETVTARYRSLGRLVNDLRANGLTNVLRTRRPLTKSALASIEVRFGAPVLESFAIITLTGWARSIK